MYFASFDHIKHESLRVTRYHNLVPLASYMNMCACTHTHTHTHTHSSIWTLQNHGYRLGKLHSQKVL